MRGPPRDLRILLIEDDEVDVLCIKRHFDRSPGRELVVASNARDGLGLLHSWQREPPTPTVVLLDLNLPQLSGLEFLDQVRADAALASAIVFVITTSTDPRDISAAWERNVSGYLAKCKAEEFQQKLEHLDHYLSALELPGG